MNNRGVTLVELIVVIVIIGVVSAFAVPATTRYFKTAKQESVYNTVLVIEDSAEAYCLENTCSTGDELTDSELGEYMTNIDTEFEYTATLLANGSFAVTYYKEGEYSFPSNDDGELITGMVPSLVTSAFVKLYGSGTADAGSGDSGDDDDDEFVPPVGEPYVRLEGAATVYVEYGGTYTEPGYNATASDGSSISNKWNSGMGGTWGFTTTEITYSCYSSVDSKSCQEAKRYVVIVDTTPPEVHVNGSTTVYVNQGNSFTDWSGAWAGDKSNTASAVTSTDDINTSVKGTYYITYSSTDSSGNTGTATRTVIVR